MLLEVTSAELTDKELLMKLMLLSGWNQSEVARQLLFHRVQVSKVMREKQQLRPIIREKVKILIQQFEQQHVEQPKEQEA